MSSDDASSSVVDEKVDAGVPAGPAVGLGKGQKAFMLGLFCFAEFMDAFGSSALFPAIPAIEDGLGVAANEITWEFSAYSATFAAFLLISGRISDLYSSKWTFIVGSAFVGLFSLGCALVKNKVGMFILRALTGVGGALTVPSALSLIIEWFPEPAEQQQGIALFGGSSALGNVLGIIFGAFVTQWASWRWVFYLLTCMGVPIAILSYFVVPGGQPRNKKGSLLRLDLPGVSMITASMILFIYAVTSGPSIGWKTANVIAPLIISVLLAIGFFIVEALLPEDVAALPPKTWFYPNFGILVGVATLPFVWWCSLFYQLMPLFQEEYGWGTVMTAVHFLPTGVFSALVAGVSSNFVKYINPKWSILGGLTLDFIATMILPFANTSDKYWSHLFVAFTIGTIGNMIVYTNANIAIFMNTPPQIAGIVGAVFNTSLQLGLALGLAIITSISASRTNKLAAEGKPAGYSGIADAYWFVLAWVVTIIVSLLVFYKVPKNGGSSDEGGVDPETAKEAALSEGLTESHSVTTNATEKR